MTIQDLYDYSGTIIAAGKGDRVVKSRYDGVIDDIESPADFLEEMQTDSRGVCRGSVQAGEFILES